MQHKSRKVKRPKPPKLSDKELHIAEIRLRKAGMIDVLNRIARGDV